MKKRFLLPLVAVATVIPAVAGLNHLGNEGNKEYLAQCNAGNTEICSKVFKGTGGNLTKKITNREYLKKYAREQRIASAKARAAKAAEENRLWTMVEHISADKNRTRSSCVSYIKGVLKDPNSYRELSVDYLPVGNQGLAVNVNFTATNGFGGRIKQSHVCGA